MGTQRIRFAQDNACEPSAQISPYCPQQRGVPLVKVAHRALTATRFRRGRAGCCGSHGITRCAPFAPISCLRTPIFSATRGLKLSDSIVPDEGCCHVPMRASFLLTRPFPNWYFGPRSWCATPCYRRRWRMLSQRLGLRTRGLNGQRPSVFGKRQDLGGHSAGASAVGL